MLGSILPRTPYIHSSTLGLNMVSVSAHLAETRCIPALPLLSLLDSVLAVFAGSTSKIRGYSLDSKMVMKFSGESILEELN
jgi:hypothetical protein